tara:strand:+ start:23 stop:208 length:186 start_codon:yes stop_codon:yes gene_type:complete
LKNNKQLELFPETHWKKITQLGVTYNVYTGGISIPMKTRLQERMKVDKFIKKYNKKLDSNG